MRAYVTGIREETDTLGAVVRNFLNFAKPTELVLGSVDVRAIVERAAEDIRGEVEARTAAASRVRGEFLPHPGGRSAAAPGVQQSVPQRRSKPASRRTSRRMIAIEAAPDQAQRVLRLSFIDNGPGVDPALATRVFQPFVTTRARGTGLGLALVQKIVVIHNGRVTVQPEPGGGFALHRYASARRRIPAYGRRYDRLLEIRCSARAHAVDSNGGFTLIESLVATGLLVTIALGSAQLFTIVDRAQPDGARTARRCRCWRQPRLNDLAARGGGRHDRALARGHAGSQRRRLVPTRGYGGRPRLRPALAGLARGRIRDDDAVGIAVRVTAGGGSGRRARRDDS